MRDGDVKEVRGATEDEGSGGKKKEEEAVGE